MNKYEQVQEMARTLHEAREHLCVGAECEFYMYPIESFDCRELWNAKTLYAKGYRKVKRGEWNLIGNGNGRAIHRKCSVCGYETLDAANGDTDFCPICGADMRGE